jgi:pimeloyl-ACP methyl ester carboxylesterase
LTEPSARPAARDWEALPGLHVSAFGPGERSISPIVLIHGSAVADPDRFWAAQCDLATQGEVLVLHRRGYGRSPLVPGKNPDHDAADILELCRGVGAHLVGHGFGAVVALYFAVRRPDRVRSLTLVEPLVLQAAPERPEAQALWAKLGAVFARRSDLTPEEYSAEVAQALDQPAPDLAQLTADDRQALLAAMVEPAPWEVPLDFDAVRACGWPKLVVTSGAHPGVEAAADGLAERIGALRKVLADGAPAISGLSPAFNDCIRPLLDA